MKKILVLILIIPVIVQSQTIVDSVTFRFSQGDIKYFIVRDRATASGSDSLMVIHNGVRTSLSPMQLPISTLQQTALDGKQNSLGFIPYNSTNPNGYISSVPAQTFSSLTGKPTTLSGYGITDAQPLGTYATGSGTASGTNTGDNATNTTYANDYRLANFIAGTNYLAPNGSAAALTGLPVSTGISGLAAGVSTFLATPTSANLAAAVTNETGTGTLVFNTNPALTTPNIGSAAGTSLTLTASSSIGTFQFIACTRTVATTGCNIIDPAGTLATLTITLPASPSNNQQVSFSFSQTITALTVTGGTLANSITTVSAGGIIRLVFNTAAAKWFQN